ncbi:hypothetical protein SESBI_44570, partial [Sesbania bispinosa]
EEKAKVKDLHPKLLAGQFFFSAHGATSGLASHVINPFFKRNRKLIYCNSP